MTSTVKEPAIITSGIHRFMNQSEREAARRYAVGEADQSSCDVSSDRFNGDYRSVLSHFAAFLAGMDASFTAPPTRERNWSKIMKQCPGLPDVEVAIRLVSGVRMDDLKRRKRVETPRKGDSYLLARI